MSKTVTIDNPNTGQKETLNQEQFNKYMAMTNGAVLNWIVDDAGEAKA